MKQEKIERFAQLQKKIELCSNLSESANSDKYQKVIAELNSIDQRPICEYLLNELNHRFVELKNKISQTQAIGENYYILNDLNRSGSESIIMRIIDEIGKIVNFDFVPLCGPLCNITYDEKLGIKKLVLQQAIESEIEIINELKIDIDYPRIKKYYSQFCQRMHNLEL